jgi:hypothetical protein
MISRGNVWRRIVKICLFSWLCSKIRNEQHVCEISGENETFSTTFLSLLAIDPSAARTFFRSPPPNHVVKSVPAFSQSFFRVVCGPLVGFCCSSLGLAQACQDSIKFFYRFLKIWLNPITVGNREVVGLKQSHSRNIAGPTFHKGTPDFFFFPVHVDQYDSWQWSEWSQTSIRLEDDPASGWRCQGASAVECEETVSLTDVPESPQGHALRWTQPRIFSARSLL